MTRQLVFVLVGLPVVRLRYTSWQAWLRNAQVLSPDQVLDFPTLYEQNCAGCHGKDGNGGAATPISNPTYVALVEPDALRRNNREGCSRHSDAGHLRRARAEC